MTEATLKGALVKAIRAEMPGWVVIRHEDQYTSGVPDISVTGNGKTSWWEVKFANPRFASKGIQDLTLTRLARAGKAWYVVYSDSADFGKQTFVVFPGDLASWRDSIHVAGYNHKWVIEMMRTVHEA